MISEFSIITFLTSLINLYTVLYVLPLFKYMKPYMQWYHIKWYYFSCIQKKIVYWCM